MPDKLKKKPKILIMVRTQACLLGMQAGSSEDIRPIIKSVGLGQASVCLCTCIFQHLLAPGLLISPLEAHKIEKEKNGNVPITQRCKHA